MSMPAGDHSDDDGQVLESLVEPQNNPLPKPLQVMTRPTAEEPPRVQRLLTGTLPVKAGWEPFMILPADASRDCIEIQCLSATPEDYVLIADAKSKCASDGNSFRVKAAMPLKLRHYTGPIWVAPGLYDTSISYVAVTS